jgi:hypothetical protein
MRWLGQLHRHRLQRFGQRKHARVAFASLQTDETDMASLFAK